jgi:hypothetical protein
MSTFPDGVFEYGGAPVSGGRFSSPWATHWFVDGVSGNDGNDGKGPTSAKSTIDAAAQLMGVGDVCYIRPQTYVVGTGHARYTECVTIDLAQSDLTFIGAGYPRNNEFGVRMKATSSEVYCLDSSAPSLHLENMAFFSDGTATNTIILRSNGATNTQRNDGCVLYNCHFKDATALIQGGQAQRIISCTFQYLAGQLVLGTPSSSSYNVRIQNCAFLDSGTTAPTHPQITDGGGGAYCLWIDHSYFGKIPTTTAYYISIAGANSSGMITDSFFNTTNLDTDDDISIASSNFMLVGCYDKTGLVDATAD